MLVDVKSHKKRRCHFVTSIPSPYQLDFFNSLELLAPGSFTVTFSAAQEIDRQYYPVPSEFGFDARILNHRKRRLGKDYHKNPELRGVLAGNPAEFTIVGGNYFMPDAWAARKHCQRNGCRFIFWGENPFKKLEGRVRRFAKETYLRQFLKPAAGVIGVGRAAAENYHRLSGSGPSVSIPYSPNLETLINPSISLRTQAQNLKSRLATQDGTVLLYAGSLIPRKDPMTLITAISRLVNQNVWVTLLIAGDGPLRAELVELVQQFGLKHHVHFLGFLSGDELNAAYLAADVFVLPTAGHEGWGVVVQEAMAAGLPVVASSRVGAAQDLVDPGSTGSLFEAGSVESLTNHLREFCSDCERRERFGNRARSAAVATSSRNAAGKLLEFIDSID